MLTYVNLLSGQNSICNVTEDIKDDDGRIVVIQFLADADSPGGRVDGERFLKVDQNKLINFDFKRII